MFQFPAFAPRLIAGVTGSLPPGCPIRISAAVAGICPLPRLFAACHVLLRLREPRHPPCALFTTCMSHHEKVYLKPSLLPLRFLITRCPVKAHQALAFSGLCLTLGFLSHPGNSSHNPASSLQCSLTSFIDAASSLVIVLFPFG